LENGNHAFRFVLNNLGLEAKDEGSPPDENTILIVFGETQALDEIPGGLIPGGLKEFINNGGAVLIATDRPNQGKWQDIFQIRFHDGFVHAPANLESAYRGLELCPWVMPQKVDEIPIFPGLFDIATNKPAHFINGSKKLRTLATFPADCWIEDGRKRIPLREGATFAAAGLIGKGRALVLSDHSVFINEMMLQNDNANLDFARRCISWLKDSGEGQPERTQVLFLDEGETIKDFKVPEIIGDLPMPGIEALNCFLVAIEQKNVFNQLILGNDPGRTMGHILRALTILITTAVAGFGCYRFLHARHRMETSEPLFATKMAQQSPEVDVMTQRHLTMIKADNFWEAAHHLAGDWFETVTPGLLAQVAESDDPRSGLISFTVDAGWWRRWSWQRKLKDLWRLAVGSPRKLTAAEFARFVTQLDEVRAAQLRGILQFRNMN
jgi:hypothetical protein